MDLYDIYLFTGVRTLPPTEKLLTAVPAFEEPAALELFQERIQQRNPAFLSLDLKARSVIAVFQYVRSGKATGYILPAAYRQPRISSEEAFPLVEAAMLSLKADLSPEQQTTSLKFAREEPVCWAFNLTYGQRTRVSVHIDKLDGHVWQKRDLRRVWEMPYFLGEVAHKLRVPCVVPATQDDPQQTYDIYLVRGAAKLPALDDLAEAAPVLQLPVLRQLLTQRNAHLLKVGLSRTNGLELLRRLEREGAWGSLLSSAYRHPRITMAQGLPLAERALAEQQVPQRPDDTLGALHFSREEPCCWTYGASSEQLASEERIPGMIFVSVDKLDGHIWSPAEFELFLGDN